MSMHNGRLSIDRIRDGRTFHRLARHVELLDNTTSTNDRAWEWVAQPEADGVVVFAEHQSAGRGRMGRTWSSPRGASIMFSTLLIHSNDTPTPRPEHLSLIAGIATAQAIGDVSRIDAQLDWPNDIVVDRRKLGGILVEARTVHDNTRAWAVGIGVNCLQHPDHFPTELRSRATSVEIESDEPVQREILAGEILTRLDQWMAQPHLWTHDTIRSAYIDRATPFGRAIRLEYLGRRFSGHIVDLDPSDGIVVQLENGGRQLFPAAGTTLIRSPET